MDVTVKVSDAIASQAQARGMSLKAYVEEILAQQTVAQTPPAKSPPSEQEIREWLDSLAQFSDQIPPLPEVITREWIYQDHD